jgi:UDP-N-acetylglucosamine 2-epimerase (non-hydrolysing)
LHVSAMYPLVFPVHPRTAAKLNEHGWMEELQGSGRILLSEPLGYFDFLKLVSNARLVITDSGGVQEETSFLNVPCVTFRKNTERPVTVDPGTNVLMSIRDDAYAEKIEAHVERIGKREKAAIPLWDEQVSKRILDFINGVIDNRK